MAESNYSIITKIRRRALAGITSGATSTISPITHMAFGDGGVDSGGNVRTPTETQTSLNNELKRYPIDGYTFPVDTTVRYTATIPKSELVGANISEMALVDGNGDLCAIKNMSSKGKDDGVVFTFELDDIF